jgi:hypothetical protein
VLEFASGVDVVEARLPLVTIIRLVSIVIGRDIGFIFVHAAGEPGAIRPDDVAGASPILSTEAGWKFCDRDRTPPGRIFRVWICLVEKAFAILEQLLPLHEAVFLVLGTGTLLEG